MASDTICQLSEIRISSKLTSLIAPGLEALDEASSSPDGWNVNCDIAVVRCSKLFTGSGRKSGSCFAFDEEQRSCVEYKLTIPVDDLLVRADTVYRHIR